MEMLHPVEIGREAGPRIEKGSYGHVVPKNSLPQDGRRRQRVRPI
jgi:hypothetical protein